jgi:hypothetical protein
MYILKLVSRSRFSTLYISVLYQHDHYTSTTGGTTLVPDATQQGILSMTIYSISTTPTTVRKVVQFLYHPDDTQLGPLTVHRPHRHCHCTTLRRSAGHFLNITTLPPLFRPDHRHNTPCTCCLPCSCPCPAPRVYPLPARTSRRLRGGRRLAVTVTSLAGGRRGP